MIILILLVITLVYMMAVSFIYFDTADRFSKNKEMYAMLGFMLPILPILLGVMLASVSNLVIGHFPSIEVGETFLMVSLVGYTLFVFLLPQFLSAKWGRSKELQESYNAHSSGQAQAAEPREPTYHNSESRSENMKGF